jgi:hypothetical protein
MLARLPLIIVMALILLASPALSLANDGAFQRTWDRTDKPVASGWVARTWMWGPESFTGSVSEEYAESPGGTRDVQYFDKARMEVTNPDAVDDGVWYVTNGLLVVELMTGRVQTGNATFIEREPADVNVAGDADDADGITYAALAAVAQLDSERHEGGEPVINELLWFGGSALQPRYLVPMSDPALAEYSVTFAEYVDETDKWVASPFWDFMSSSGLVHIDNAITTAALFPNPYYATGYPITNAYWATIKVANTEKDVLIQCFERRCLTFTPDNPEGWQVEAGNVGRHYHAWRYAQTKPEPSPTPTPGTGFVFVSSIQGIETSPGSVDGDTRYGATFVGTSAGDVPGTFRASINYTPPSPGGGVTNTVVGGDWSITSETGSVNGIFQGASAQWDAEGDYATISAIMKVVARSGDFEGLPREARFHGTLSHTVFPPRIAGTLTIYP